MRKKRNRLVNGCCLQSKLGFIPRIFFLLLTLLVILAFSFRGQETWKPLRWTGRTTKSGAAMQAAVAKTQLIVDVFMQSDALNPPKGMSIEPTAKYLKRLDLVEDETFPEPIELKIGFRMPPNGRDIVAGLNVWINEPYNLLGDPIFKDNKGDMYLLPPIVGKKAGQTVYSRSAHPAGYDEEYPSKGMFPLWGLNQEPFLRSVVRPTFGLKKNTLTRLFTHKNKPFWKPVSQERWILALIASAQAEVEVSQSGLNAADELQITDLQIKQLGDYLKRIKGLFSEESVRERHAKTLENAHMIYDMMKNTHLDEAEKYYVKAIANSNEQLEEALAATAEQIPEIEEYERKLMQALITRGQIFSNVSKAIRNENWDEIEELGKEYDLNNLIQLADAGRAIRRLQTELDGLSAAERNAPAYGFEMPPHHPLGPHRQVVAMPFEAKRPSGLVDSNAKNARQIVCIDPDFFRFNDDDGAIRLLAIEWMGMHDLRYDQDSKILLDEIWETLNWRKLGDFVR